MAAFFEFKRVTRGCLFNSTNVDNSALLKLPPARRDINELQSEIRQLVNLVAKCFWLSSQYIASKCYHWQSDHTTIFTFLNTTISSETSQAILAYKWGIYVGNWLHQTHRPGFRKSIPKHRMNMHMWIEWLSLDLKGQCMLSGKCNRINAFTMVP